MRAKNILKIRGKSKASRIIASILFKRIIVDIPWSVEIEKGVSLVHDSPGLVINRNTTIKANARIYQGVTIGRADIYNDKNDSRMEAIIIDEGAIICAGAKVLCKEGTLRVGKNTIVGANAVLMSSTGDNEVWAGIPAKKIGTRKDNKGKNK